MMDGELTISSDEDDSGVRDVTGDILSTDILFTLSIDCINDGIKFLWSQLTDELQSLISFIIISLFTEQRIKEWT